MISINDSAIHYYSANYRAVFALMTSSIIINVKIAIIRQYENILNA